MRLLPFDYAARNTARNPLRSILVTGGAAAVIFLVILMGSFVQALGSTLRKTGDPLNVIVLGTGSEDFLEQSEIGFNIPTILASSVEGIAHHAGKPMISPEIHHAAAVRLSESELTDPASVRLGLARGITPLAFLVHQQIYLREGRTPALGEVMVGRLAATKLGFPEEALRPGKTIYFEGKSWTVSGTFEAPGTAYEAELWVPLEDLKIQTKRDSLTCAIVRLTDQEMISELEIFAKSRLDLECAVIAETKYYGSLATFFRPMQVLGLVMAALVVASGLFGGLNTMMAAIAARARELAFLETIGFSRRAIVLSLLQESLLQVSTGALIAAALAMILLADRAIRFSMGALSLEINGPVLALAFGAGLFLAVVGTVLPSLKLCRTPLVEMLRG